MPVLSEYATEERREELDGILSTLLSLASVVLIAVVVVLELGAPWVAPLLLGGFDVELLRTATMLVRLIVPAIIIYGISGILQAYHYARKRFVYPSLGAPAHNLGVIVAVVLLAGKLDLASLSVGIVAAATVQLLVQLPAARHAPHPAVELAAPRGTPHPAAPCAGGAEHRHPERASSSTATSPHASGAEAIT